MISWLAMFITAGSILGVFGIGAALFAVRRVAWKWVDYDPL